MSENDWWEYKYKFSFLEYVTDVTSQKVFNSATFGTYFFLILDLQNVFNLVVRIKEITLLSEYS